MTVQWLLFKDWLLDLDFLTEPPGRQKQTDSSAPCRLKRAFKGGSTASGKGSEHLFGGQVSTFDLVQTAKIVYHRDGYNALELAIKAGHQCVVEVILQTFYYRIDFDAQCTHLLLYLIHIPLIIIHLHLCLFITRTRRCC